MSCTYVHLNARTGAFEDNRYRNSESMRDSDLPTFQNLIRGRRQAVAAAAAAAAGVLPQW